MNIDPYIAMARVRIFLERHHPVVFITILGILLAIAFFMMYQVISAQPPTDNSISSSIGGFDKKTVDKIKELHDSKDIDNNVELPASRPSPFVE